MMPIITNFSGGLVTGVDPIYLDTTQSSVLLDAKIDRVGMQSELQPEYIGEAGKSFYQFPIYDSDPEAFLISSSADDRTYAEFQCQLAYSDGGPVCKITGGEIDPLTGEFIWYTMGVDPVEGTIVARAITVDEDISGGSITINVGVGGHLQAQQIRYRVVDANDTVYIHDLFDNTGNSTATITLPDDTYKVFREVLDSYGGYTNKFLLVGQGSFVDGLVEINDEYTYVQEEEVADFSGHRLSLLDSLSYSVTYEQVVTDDKTVLNISNLYSINASKVWATYPIDIQLSLDTEEAVVGIASTFVFDGSIYIMAKLGKLFKIYKYSDLSLVVDTESDIDAEYFKGTTIEYADELYMFNLIGGKVAKFNGSTFEIEDFVEFPYAAAEDTVLTLKEGTNEVYGLINTRHEANVRKITLPDLGLELVDEERVGTAVIRGLGGTSGSVFTDGDFQVFPVHNVMIKYSPTTHQLIEDIGNSTLIPTLTSRKGFTMNTASSTLVVSVYTALLAELANIGIWENDLENEPTWFNLRTITGTILYNVAQKTPDGLSEGPIMYVGSEPLNIYLGHIRVDLSDITHDEPLRLYRTGGYLTVYTMVEDVDPTTLYIDKRDDVTIALGRNGDLSYVDAPPEGLKWLTEHNGLLFGAVNNVLYWSLAGQSNSWDLLNSYAVMDREVTGLASCSNGLTIFMRGRSKLLTGATRAEFAIRALSNSKGTIDSKSIQAIDNGVLFFSEDGLCFTDGSIVQELSFSALGNQKFNVVDSMVTNRSYYALLSEYTNSSLNIARVILRLDYGTEVPIFTLLSADGVDGLGMVHGKLAHSSDGRLFDTLSGEDRVLNYKSGRMSEGYPTMVKEWDRVRVTGRFKGILKVSIDDVTVMEELIDVTNNNLVNKHIPKRVNKGKYIMFELIGTGFIASIEYTITPRKTVK